MVIKNETEETPVHIQDERSKQYLHVMAATKWTGQHKDDSVLRTLDQRESAGIYAYQQTHQQLRQWQPQLETHADNNSYRITTRLSLFSHTN